MSETFKHNLSSHVRVGFNKRVDTYSGLLGYVTWGEMNTKGIIKYGSETSFQSWRDKSIDVMEFENVPRSGFVLNQKAGGNRYSWNPRLVKARVYDPLGFEFEISMDNLLYILENCYTTPGKALEGEFVYTFMDGSVFLMPTNSIEYKELISNKTSTKLSKKDLNNLEFGDVLKCAKGEYLYIGEFTSLKEESKKYSRVVEYHVGGKKPEKYFVKIHNDKAVVVKTPKDIIEIVKDSNMFDNICNLSLYYKHGFDGFKCAESLEYAVKNHKKVYGKCFINKISNTTYQVDYSVISSEYIRSNEYSFIEYLKEINNLEK